MRGVTYTLLHISNVLLQTKRHFHNLYSLSTIRKRWSQGWLQRGHWGASATPVAKIVLKILCSIEIYISAIENEVIKECFFFKVLVIFSIKKKGFLEHVYTP